MPEIRRYDIDKIAVNGIDTEVDFSATISQSGEKIELKYDGYIFIKDKDFG